ncbi:MAG TPA: Gldg family protein [Anaeromyxobacteraceae bacterium]|nr:Gldg family protein [Anaeromyxobacteraceae bacterium]
MRRALPARILSVVGVVILASTLVTFLFGNVELVLWKAGVGLAVLVAGLALSERRGLKRFFTGRAAHFGFFTLASALLLGASLAALNWMAYRRPASWDLTRNRIHTLAPDTVRTVSGLAADTRALAFYRQDEAGYAPSESLLRQYAALSRHFTFQMVDPYRNPELVKRFGITEGGPRVVLSLGPGEARLKEVDEESLTNALVRLTHPGKRRVYFTDGHGEPSLDDGSRQGYSRAVQALDGENLEAVRVSLARTGAVPEDAAAVVVAGARKAFLDAEVSALRRYLAGGGHLAVFLEPEVNAGLDALLKDMGVEADDDMVVDPNPLSRLVGGSPVTPILKLSAAHPVSASLGEVGVVFPTARSLVALHGARARPVPLALSAQSAWGETDIRGLFTTGAKQDEGEKVGPLPLAMAVEWPVEGSPRRQARAIVAGDSDFFTNGYQQMLGNLDFFLSAMSWLAERDDRFVIRPRSREASRLQLSEAQVALLKFVTIDAMPVALVVVGLAVWLARRSR